MFFTLIKRKDGREGGFLSDDMVTNILNPRTVNDSFYHGSIIYRWGIDSKVRLLLWFDNDVCISADISSGNDIFRKLYDATEARYSLFKIISSVSRKVSPLIYGNYTRLYYMSLYKNLFKILKKVY